ncbi:3-isopropylmalate dehydrogenase [Syntrophobotulus glycolicus DSM 8271]|uniref:3-isopropylmalate dehydrogenase n=1 Tax=Syntrophobotulus glycolicus (strain DSM 8271 / FlGlyR) TaxID=645991 RepID=F0T2P2_SYNGF|nr:3-isopropylmalate dehydrogenase [Syntrophobotulus glycolicus]ADY56441.1 3-isopropylmalate dehydrogenase [Syntrophobotulus glycolicus DSM 8271]
MPKIAVLPGDGIGQEIIPEALKVLDAVLKNSGEQFQFQEYLIGGAAIDARGKALPEDTLAACKEADAVLLGAIGGPKWDTLPAQERPELGGLLALRKELELYANIRPIKMMPSLISSSALKEEIVRNVDMVVIRELTGGLYFGEKGRKEHPKAAYDVLVYTEEEIRRIVEFAFVLAGQRRKKLCSVDKANVLESSRFWREIVLDLAPQYPEVEVSQMYVDNAAMQLVRYPEQFDVIVTENMFGDILTDLASMLGGSIGMLASASMSGKKGLYEPAHGSAPDIAGQNKANPLATILSAAMMLKWTFGLNKEGQLIEDAVTKVLDQGYRTADLGGDPGRILGTRQMGDAVVDALR